MLGLVGSIASSVQAVADPALCMDGAVEVTRGYNKGTLTRESLVLQRRQEVGLIPMGTAYPHGQMPREDPNAEQGSHALRLRWRKGKSRSGSFWVSLDCLIRY